MDARYQGLLDMINGGGAGDLGFIDAMDASAKRPRAMAATPPRADAP